MKDDNAYCCSQDKVNFFRLDELRFCIPLDTKKGHFGHVLPSLSLGYHNRFTALFLGPPG